MKKNGGVIYYNANYSPILKRMSESKRRGRLPVSSLLWYDVSMTDKEELKLVYKLLNKMAKEYGTAPCKDYAPECANCLGQQLMGLLEWHAEILRT